MTTAAAAGPTTELMQQINDAFNARDPERIATFFADDATFFMARGPEPCGRRVHGKDAMRLRHRMDASDCVVLLGALRVRL